MALRLGPARHGLPAQVLAVFEQPGVPQRRHDLVRHRLQDRHPDPVRAGRMLRADQQRPDLAVIQPHRSAQHDRPRRTVADGHHLRRIRDPGDESGRILRRGGAQPLARLPVPVDLRWDRGGQVPAGQDQAGPLRVEEPAHRVEHGVAERHRPERGDAQCFGHGPQPGQGAFKVPPRSAPLRVVAGLRGVDADQLLQLRLVYLSQNGTSWAASLPYQAARQMARASSSRTGRGFVTM